MGEGNNPGAQSEGPRDLGDLGEFKRPQGLLSASVGISKGLQHEGAVDLECAARGCPWQRGLCGVRVWREGGAQTGDGSTQPPASVWRRQTDVWDDSREEQTSTPWEAD